MVTKKLGRKSKPADKRRTQRISIYATPDEWALVDRAAAKYGQDMNEFVREVVITAARARLGDRHARGTMSYAAMRKVGP